MPRFQFAIAIAAALAPVCIAVGASAEVGDAGPAEGLEAPISDSGDASGEWYGPTANADLPTSISDELSTPLAEEPFPPPSYRPCMSWLGLRHSYTHGRSVGLGDTLVGTSWLNRPYYAGFDLGALWMTQSIEDSVSRDVDTFGGVFIGSDWDHYWGNELAFQWATPELINSAAPTANRTDSLFLWSYSLMYYPWGDSAVRPYWRWGIGGTHVDFPLDDGSRHDEWLLTFPIGIGVKYPVRRWLAVRADFTDQLSFGDSDVRTQNNLTLTFGLEWRFGVRPRSYWPWYPSRHIW